jgi:hypothetical protein
MNSEHDTNSPDKSSGYTASTSVSCFLDKSRAHMLLDKLKEGSMTPQTLIDQALTLTGDKHD